MKRFLAAAVLVASAITAKSYASQLPSANPAPQKNSAGASVAQSAPESPQNSGPTRPQNALPPLPAPPAGKKTVIGGSILHVDPVMDRFDLKVFGGHTMKILYDQRTHFYRNGVQMPIRELGNERHASVETVLDGTKVFAVSIHVLSKVPTGEIQGQVADYDPSKRRLKVNSALSGEAIELEVPAGTPILRTGQHASASSKAPAELIRGELIQAQFQSAGNGRGIATKIEVLAAPGTSFQFAGTVTFLDMAAGEMAVTDPRDGQRYKIFFDADRLPASHKLHRGSNVSVTARFSGSRYVATDIKFR
jgi:hypothetical protein